VSTITSERYPRHGCLQGYEQNLDVVGQAWWCMPVIPAMLELEVRGSRSETRKGKNARPYLKIKLKV
jgi:hypothetical protein